MDLLVNGYLVGIVIAAVIFGWIARRDMHLLRSHGESPGVCFALWTIATILMAAMWPFILTWVAVWWGNDFRARKDAERDK